MKEIITGTISAYIYKSEDSLYKVARIKTTEGKELIIVGSFIELEEGLEYEFVGEFIEHAKFGRQFKIESYTKTNSFSKDGLISYFSSDTFIGIGKKLATHIVETLGTDCIQLILNDASVLDQVKQLSEAKKTIVVETLKSNYASEQVIIQLFSFGLTSKMVYRLFEYYGAEAAVRVEENPYTLLYDIEGFGFKKCDALALSLGIKLNDSLRLKEAIRYTLSTVCYQQGYTFLNQNQLLNSSYILLNSSPEIKRSELEEALEILVQSSFIIQEEDRYFDVALYKSEVQCAERILKLKERKIPQFSKQKIVEAIKQVEKDIHIKYTENQKEAIEKALANKLTIITGGPGTGKSTILQGIIRSYALLHDLVFPCDDLDLKIYMMAPTGRAAKRMMEVTNFKATTIHKALHYNYEGGFGATEDSPLSCSLAIIDEASMIDINLAASLFKALPLNCQVILVGDENQLPSVGPGNVFHDCIASNLFETVRLFQVMRQAADSKIIQLSNMVLAGELDYRIFSTKKEVYFYPCEAKNLQELLFRILDSYIASGNDIKEAMQILIPMYAGVAGIDAVNQAISNRYNLENEKIVRENLIIKKLDKVLQLKNDPILQVMNGDIGIVKGITKEENKEILDIDFEGKIIRYPVKEIENLRLAYAISIHKSQGSEYENVILPILPSYHIMLKKKIIYTGITRAKKKLIIIGSLDALNQAIQTLDLPRQTGLLFRFNHSENSTEKISDPMIPFETFGEYDMEGITPYFFME